MTKKHIYLGALTFTVVFTFIAYIRIISPFNASTIHTITVHNANLTLSEDMQDKIISLNGEWDFYPNTFYPAPPTIVHKLNIFDNFTQFSKTKKYGYGCFYVQLHGLNPNIIYSLKIGHVLSAEEIIINNVLIKSEGKIAKIRKNEIPGLKSQEASFAPNPDGTTQIYINVSNFQNRKGKIGSPILLGPAQKIQRAVIFDLISYSITFGITMTLAIFFILFYFHYNPEKYIFWIALLFVTLAIRNINFYPHLIIHFLPHLNWKIAFIMRHITYPLPILFATIAIKHKIKLMYKITYTIVIVFCITYSLIIIIFPGYISANLVKPVQILTAPIILYNLAILTHAVVIKKQGARQIFIAFIPPILFFINDVLVSQSIINGIMLSADGIIITGIIISLMLLASYANAIKKIEILNQESAKTNKSLGRFVPTPLLNLLDKTNITELIPGEKTELTMPILSMDIRSFTNIAETLSTNTVFSLLNEYYSVVAPIIRKYKGIIIKYLGDGFTAVFPPSVPVKNTLNCAIEIQTTLHNIQSQTGKLTNIKAGIGIDYGPMILGVVGTQNRMESLVISETYYQAELLQKATKNYSAKIIISKDFFTALDDPTEFFIRPILKINKNNELESFLFDVYDCDNTQSKKLKRNSQYHLEKSMLAFSEKQYNTAINHIKAAIKLNPHDILYAHYLAIFESAQNHTSL